jgi:hypothetical protein
MELTLQQLFGANASQNSQYLTISKIDLVDLTAKTNNRGEQLLVAILVNALASISGTLANELSIDLADEKNSPLSFDNSLLFTELSIFTWDVKIIDRNQSTYRQNTIVIYQYEVV